MGAKIATTCLHWSQPILHHHHSPSSSSSSSLSPRRRTRYDVVRSLLCRNAASQFTLSGGMTTAQSSSSQIYYPCTSSKSHHQFPVTAGNPRRPRRTSSDFTRSCTSSFDGEFSDEEFSKQIEQLVQKFEQDSSQTSPLMVYVVVLLANYTVHSLENSYAIAGPHSQSSKFDSPLPMKRSSISKSVTARTSSSSSSSYSPRVGKASEAEEETVVMAEEMKLWDNIKEEADKMMSNDASLDRDTMLQLVSPVTAKVEEDDQADYLKTELVYQMGLAQEPNNVLLLANYAQFLYLVARDYNRAEDYFKKATTVEPPDAEAYNKYATFLWMVHKDLWAAEETCACGGVHNVEQPLALRLMGNRYHRAFSHRSGTSHTLAHGHQLLHKVGGGEGFG